MWYYVVDELLTYFLNFRGKIILKEFKKHYPFKSYRSIRIFHMHILHRIISGSKEAVLKSS